MVLIFRWKKLPMMMNIVSFKLYIPDYIEIVNI